MTNQIGAVLEKAVIDQMIKCQELAYDNCEHQNKCFLKCAKNGRCYQEELIKYFWNKLSSYN